MTRTTRLTGAQGLTGAAQAAELADRQAPAQVPTRLLSVPLMLAAAAALAVLPRLCGAEGSPSANAPDTVVSALAGAQRGVSFQGNKEISSEDLLAVLDASGCWGVSVGPGREAGAVRSAALGGPARTWGDSTEVRVRSALLEAYGREGFLGATIDSVVLTANGSGSRAVIHLTEGNQAVAGQVSFAGNRTETPEKLAAAGGIRRGMPIRGEAIQKACDDIASFLSDEGMPFAVVKAGGFRLAGNEVSFTFVIDEGSVARLSEVKLADSKALKPGALEHALGVKPGDVFSRTKLRQGVTALRRTGLFEEVGEPVLARSGDGVSVSIPVKDKRTTSVAGAVGFRGRTNELTGGLSLSVLNLARSGRSASAGWEAAGNNTSFLRFLYTEPWVSGLPFSSTVAFEHTARDTFFARTSLAVSAKVPVGRGLSGEVGASFEKTLVTDVSRSRATRAAWLAGAELFLGEPSWMSRNTLVTSLEFTRGRRKLVYLSDAGGDPGETRAFSTLKGSALVQGRVHGSQIAVLSAGLRAVLEGRNLVSGDEMFALGGKNTLRGYAERQFLAETVGSLQCEYGVAVGDDGGRAFVFVDGGYASTPATSTAERFHYGYGVGVRVPSLLGLAGIDLGVPAGESFSSAKIHVGLEGKF